MDYASTVLYVYCFGARVKSGIPHADNLIMIIDIHNNNPNNITYIVELLYSRLCTALMYGLN